jgi:hypothetical protein
LDYLEIITFYPNPPDLVTFSSFYFDEKHKKLDEKENNTAQKITTTPIRHSPFATRPFPIF